MKYKILIFLFLFFSFLSCHPSIASADENFDLSYDFFYRFLDSGETIVTQTTTLTNKTTNLYPTDYEMIIFGKTTGQISGYDDKGSLNLTVTREGEEKTKIHVNFNQKSAGLGSKLTFSINYTLLGLVNITGNIREITIPKPEKDLPLASYKVRISAPRSFGKVAFVKPFKNFDTTDNSFIFSFNFEEAKRGILIGFGEYSYFEFKLTYHLKNESLIKRRSEIAIPPDTLYQQIFYKSIEPKPVEVKIDEDGNFLAVFDLLPRQHLKINVVGDALVYSYARDNFPSQAPISNHLNPQKYWETTSDEIRRTAQKLDTISDIYHYVVSNLRYDYSRVGAEITRLGAKTALDKPDNAICMEFTDLFIALARSKGIPAREINGFAYTSDEHLKPLSLIADVLHSWPEYWDKDRKSWIPVDPTWENTTGGLDYFNTLDPYHFVFVKRGVSSIYPPAPGSYQNENTGKNVEVIPKEGAPPVTESVLNFSVNFPKKMIAGKKQDFTIKIENNSGIARYNLPIKVENREITVQLSKEELNIAPFGSETVSGEILSRKNFWGKIPLTISVGNEKRQMEVEVEPIELLYLPFYLSLFLFILIVTVMVFKKYVYQGKS